MEVWLDEKELKLQQHERVQVFRLEQKGEDLADEAAQGALPSLTPVALRFKNASSHQLQPERAENKTRRNRGSFISTSEQTRLSCHGNGRILPTGLPKVHCQTSSRSRQDP